MPADDRGRPRGTDGYGENAEVLVARYESLSFLDNHADILHLLPAAPARVVDIGAGSGRDAAGFTRLGHEVVAVEPTAEMRSRGEELHRDVAITWLDDCLPDLAGLRPMGPFDVVAMTAVWMHLDAAEREAAMAVIGNLVAPGGLLVLSLRHGPVPPGRHMFAVTGDETVALAARHGFEQVFRAQVPSKLSQPGVSWTKLAFRKRRG